MAYAGTCRVEENNVAGLEVRIRNLASVQDLIGGTPMQADSEHAVDSACEPRAIDSARQAVAPVNVRSAEVF